MGPMKKYLSTLLLTIAPLTASTQSHAEIYKCVSPDGQVSFSNNPYCEHRQAYAQDRNEPLLQVDPGKLSKAASGKIIELYYDSIDLPDLLEDIGRFAKIPLEPIGLEGNEVKIPHVSNHWLELFEDIVKTYGLDYRQAYGRIYIYQTGSMGETIVHTPDLLRWYQSDESWNAVMRNDDILLGMKVYENTELKERAHRLTNMVREALGENAAINAAENVRNDRINSSGVGSGVAARGGANEAARRAAEKAKRIKARRQAN